MSGNRLTSIRSYSFALRGSLFAAALCVAGLAACGSDPKTASDDDDDSSSSSTSSTGGGGNAQGGNAQGGNAQGGNAQGGNAQGGNAQGGNAQGGNGQGGNAQGGNGQGGSAQGGNGQGGSAQGGMGGMGQGGMAQGGMGGMGQGGMGGMGTTCLDNETCMGANAVCDPQTAQCDPNLQCDANVNCPAGETCLLQQDMATVGACYDDCVPFAAAGCGAGEECLDLTLESTTGVCFQNGPATAGQACVFHDISDGCVAGYSCVGDMNPTCVETCDFWAAGGCSNAAENCAVGGLCDSATVNPAAVGQACLNTNMQVPCGLVGDVAQGVCADPGTGFECLEWCRLNGNDCPANTMCTNVGLTVPIGLCL